MLLKSNSSHEKTSSGAICANGNVLLASILVITNGINDATAILYDKPSATGIGEANKLWEGTVPGTSQYGGRNWIFPVHCREGIYLALSGTGASAIVEYV